MCASDVAPVEILLATYNSAPWLDEQLESIWNQSYEDLRVLARDDGSTDKTLSILRSHAQRTGRLELIEDGDRLGPCGSFSRLLQAATASLVMFCDHDDVWLDEKIATSVRALQRAAGESPPQTPILVFTDLRIVDKQMRTVCESYWRLQRMNPERLALGQLLTQNVPSGCTMLLNRPLIQLSRPVPEEAVMHDHWVALTAAAKGRIVYLPEATVAYRQHGSNVFGAVGGSGWQLARRTGLDVRGMRERFYRNVHQAQAFLDRHGRRLTADQRELVEAFATLEHRGWLGRRATLIRHRIFKCGLIRNLATLLVV